MTNREYLRSLSDEELAKEICKRVSCNTCPGINGCEWRGARYGNGVLAWLRENRKEKK